MLSGPSKSEQVVEAQKLRISKLDSIKDLLWAELLLAIIDAI